MLESIKPGVLKKDVYRHAQENKLPLAFLTSLTDTELLKLEAPQLYVLPRSRKRILESKEDSPTKYKQRYNWSAISIHIQPQRSRKQNQLQVIPQTPVRSPKSPQYIVHGEGSCSRRLQTWRNQGGPSQKCLRTHQSRKKKKLHNIMQKKFAELAHVVLSLEGHNLLTNEKIWKSADCIVSFWGL